MKNMKRSVALLVAIALLIGCAAGGTMAWLIDNSNTVTNTFTTSDITITLTETDATADGSGDLSKEYKMVPGAVLTKDPTVKVVANSEDCWLFIKVVEDKGTGTYNFNDFLTYAVATGWTPGNGPDIPKNVYYRHVTNKSADQLFPILDGNIITVPNTVTKEMMDTAKSDEPQLKFAACAVQYYNNGTPFTVTEAYGSVPVDFINFN